MSGTKIQGYAALQPGAMLTPFSYNQPMLKNNEVRISITHCDVCATDIHAIDDDYAVFNFPSVPGHEVVGHISEIGSEVPPERLGERVGVGWQARACRQCEWCLKEAVHLCIELLPMSQVNQAIDKLRQGKAHYRTVLVNDRV